MVGETEHPNAVVGDGYELYQGDCLDVMASLREGSVDLCLTDPPYGTTACKWDSVIPFEPMWEGIKHVAKPNAAIALFGSQPFTSMLGASNISQLRYAWVWEKSAATGHLNAKRMPMKNNEDVLVFYTKQPKYNPQGTEACDIIVRRGHNGDNYGESGNENRQTQKNYPRTVIQFRSMGKTVHPTQKPVALLEYLIRTYTDEGDTVLDFTMGSGSTGVAAMNTNRKFIGIELDPGYFDIAVKRIENSVARETNG